MFDRTKDLFRSLAIYGIGDVLTALLSLLLLPVYTRYLTPTDYGIIALLLTVEAATKIVFRWGLDTAFMRLYYDCGEPRARQRLASTIVFFLGGVNGSLLAGALLSAGWLSQILFGTPDRAILIRLVVANLFVMGFQFVPLQVLRINERSGQFIALVLSRSAGVLVLRLGLVIIGQLGILGLVLADLIITAVFSVVLIRWYAPLIRLEFSLPVLRESLRFGLPRIPHALAQQVIGLADRYFLNAFATLRDVGLYSIGASFGLALKLFLSAFEYAWTPFFLSVMREPDAKRIYGAVSTYIVAALVLLVAGLCAIAPDVVRLTTTREFHEAAAVTPWIALGVTMQGFYLVGSIGLVITKQTQYYPLTTGIAAGVSLLANALLIPRFGMMGAAWANAIAYATLAGVTLGFSRRVYPIPYEWRRLGRVAAAGVAAYTVAALVPQDLAAAAGIALRGVVVVATYGVALGVTRFVEPKELSEIRHLFAQLPAKPLRPVEAADDQVELGGEILAGVSTPVPATALPAEDSKPSRQ